MDGGLKTYCKKHEATTTIATTTTTVKQREKNTFISVFQQLITDRYGL